MNQAPSAHEVDETARKLLEEGLGLDAIRGRLEALGTDATVIKKCMDAIRAARARRRRKRGFYVGVTGSVLLVLGFLLTVIFYHSGISIGPVMYGLTTLGVILLIYGLIEVLGW